MANTDLPADVHGTGMPRHSHGYTSFASYSHQQLYSMLFASDPATVREAAAAWLSTGRMLSDQAQQLKHRLVNFAQMWQGAAADEYKTMITDLANGLDKVGTGALAMNDLMSQSAEAVEKARAAMPPPQQVPDLDPQVMAAATAAPPAEIAASPAAQAQFATSQAQAQQAVQAHQDQVTAANASQAQAVQVMQTLATEYGGTEDSVPAAPESVATGPTGVPDGSSEVPVPMSQTTGLNDMPGLSSNSAGMVIDSSGNLIGASSTGTPSASVPTSPLFGHMFTAGLAAASAAASGRFGSVMPRLPSFLNPKPKNPDGTAAASAAGVAARAAAARAAAAAKLSAGGGGGGFGGGSLAGVGGGGGGISGPTASAYPGLISGSGGASVAGAAAAGQLAGAAAGAQGASGTSAMPMMPMGGMGAGAGGDMGGRRIPPWLVETEDVWGESSAVSPPVIGE